LCIRQGWLDEAIIIRTAFWKVALDRLAQSAAGVGQTNEEA
jgi:hypothetical protein